MGGEGEGLTAADLRGDRGEVEWEKAVGTANADSYSYRPLFRTEQSNDVVTGAGCGG